MRLPPFKRPVLVLPACDAVPAALSNRNPIDFGDNIATAAALSAVWTDISRAPIVRADVIVIEQVAADHAGVALTNDTADEVSLTLGEAPDLPGRPSRLSGWSSPIRHCRRSLVAFKCCCAARDAPFIPQGGGKSNGPMTVKFAISPT